MKKAVVWLVSFALLLACSSTSSIIPQPSALPTTDRPIGLTVRPIASATPTPLPQNPRFSPAQNACWNLGYVRPDVSGVEVMKCGQDDLDQQKARLTNLIAAIKVKITERQQQPETWMKPPDDMQAKLDEAQKDWETFIEKHCRWEARFNSGSSSQPMVYVSCMATRTTERIEQLKTLWCVRGDVFGSCSEADKY